MLNNPAKIASCNICLLAECMKLCASCPLNPGKLTLKPAEVAQVNRTELLKPNKDIKA